ncbi:MAG: hypothetical protein HGB18_05140 [Candidatus Moranbacteria bacterium]|nr:hypothetical protein [Candidatus Moranbacteria bacterium]
MMREEERSNGRKGHGSRKRHPVRCAEAKRPGRRSVALSHAESAISDLRSFLDRYELKDRRSLGRKFRVRDFIYRRFRFLRVIPWKRIFCLVRIVAVRSFAILMIAAVVYSVTPGVLSAPKSVGISTYEEWHDGSSTTLDMSDTDGAIRLQPDGTWNKRVWGVPQDGYINGGFNSGSTSVSVGRDIYVSFGTGTRSWFRYSIDSDSYEPLPDLPFALSSGSDLGFDGDRTIYMTFGAYSRKFYEYDTVERTFTEQEQTPDTICGGSNVEVYGGYVYVNRGCGATDFWRFDISADEWQNRAPVPAGPSTGASLVTDSGRLYLTRGNSSKTFYSYDVSADSWSTKTNLPDFPRFSSAVLNYAQKGLAYTDPNSGKHYAYYLYIWEGTPTSGVDNGIASRYSYMVRYDVAANSWEILDATPLNLNGSVNDASMQLDPVNNQILVFRATGTYDLWKFDIATGKFVGPAVVNGGLNGSIGTGGDLIWNGQSGVSSSLYTVRGGGNAQLYRYDVTANSWTALANFPMTNNSDFNGTFANGYVYYLRSGSANSTTFYRYDVSTNTWSADNALTGLPVSVSDGAALAYNASDGYVYALRGAGTNGFYRYDITSNTWTALASMSASNKGFSSLIAATGASIVSSGTDLFVMPGNGETAFLKYSTGSSSWTGLTSTPFVQYHGTDMAYSAGKIYALAGFYRDEVWEYTIASDTWRKVAPLKELSYGRGPYNGASIEYAGGNSFFALIGQGSQEMLSFTPGSANYIRSGSYVSQAIDLGNVEQFVGFQKTDSIPSNTSVSYETRTSEDGKSWGGWSVVNGTSIGSTPQRYLQARITLTSSDGVSTPSVSGWSVDYTSEDAAPTNPDVITAHSQRVGGTELVSGSAYADERPYFTWSGADDSGSGVAGYFVYFGTDAGADPQADGAFQENTVYEVHEPLDRATYHLRIRTKDRNGTVSPDIWDAFSYVYDGVSPALSEIRTTKADFDRGTFDGVSSTRTDGNLTLAPSNGFWNESRQPTLPLYAYNEAKLVRVDSAGSTAFYSVIAGNRPNLYKFDPVTSVWTALTNAPTNIYYGGDMAAGPNGFLYVTAGGGTPTFLRYDIAQNSWSTVASAPQNFTYGATLVYDGNRYIYGTPGGDNSVFRYDTQNNSWSTVAVADFKNPESTYQSLSTGSDVIFDGEKHLYYLQGGGYPYFARFAMSADTETGESAGTWKSLSPVPVAPSSGGNIAFNPETGTIYYFSGGSRNFFFRYDIGTDTWSRLPDSPVTIGYGASSLVYGQYLYTQTGDSSTYFLRFNLEKNSWETPARGVFVEPHYSYGTYYGFGGGASITRDDEGNAYVVRGNYDTLFQRYNPVTGKSSALATLPIGAIDGAQIAYVSQENAVYYVVPSTIGTRRSNAKNNYFYRYDIATNTWTAMSNDLPPAQVNSSGVSMVYDGSRYLYLTAAGGGSTWWRYDRLAASGSRWSSALPTYSGWTQGTASRLLYKDGYVYSTKAQGTNQFYRYSVSGSSWARMADAPGTLSSGAALIDGEDGYLYATQGGNTSGYYRYSISGNSWETLDSIPAQVSFGGGGAGMYAGHRIWTIAGSGTNTLSDGLYSYVVSSPSQNVGFVSEGTYVSDVMDLVSVYGWAGLSVDYEQPANTYVVVETRSSEDGSLWSEWSASSDERIHGERHDFGIVSPKARYMQVRLTLSSTDRIYSPSVSEIGIRYYQDIDAPENPRVVAAFSSSTKSESINPEDWHSGAEPHFEWPSEGSSGAASDNEGGSGIAGYWVYFGTQADADPFAKGVFQTDTEYTASSLVSGQEYHLRIKAVDRAGMLPADTYDAFVYRYDATAPSAPSDIAVTPAGYTSIDSYSFLWPADASDTNSGIAKYQYRTGGDDAGVWYDLADPETVSLTIPNADHVTGAYQSGKNTLSLRVVDIAGNVSSTITQDYYYSASAPTPPQNLEVSPESSSSNSFSFSWETPVSFVGDVAKLKYYYSVNALPTAYNTVETTNVFAGPGPFATQRGPNTFYVVAMDEAGNIDYNLYSSVSFDADTSAPPVPVNVQAFDTSDRETAEYSVAVKWSVPDGIDSGNFAGYAIFRSLDGTNFSEVATTTGSAYVDTGLESRQYSYFVKSKDRTNNYSIGSSTVSLTPTGRYTHPPLLVGEPKYSTQSFAASFSWATSRIASSFVEYGESISLGKTNGQVDSVTDHAVDLTGLEADTKYFYRVKFIDPDGNIGMSDIATFTTLPPPTVSDFAVSDITLESAYVSWETNTSATCTLKYGAGSLSSSIKESSGSVTHVEKVDGLSAETDYMAQVECVDDDLNSFSSDQYRFSTPVKPTATDIRVQNMEGVDLPTVTVDYVTNVPTTTYVTFGYDGETPHTYLVTELATEHHAELSGLDPAKEYALSIGGADGHGIALEAATQKITTRTDSRPPEILTNRAVGKTVGRGLNAQANIYVKIETNEPTTVKINYAKGVASSNFEQSTAEDPINTYHLITIPAEIGQVYSYQAKVIDAAGNVTAAPAVSVVVEQAKETAAEVISGTITSRFGWIGTLWSRQ